MCKIVTVRNPVTIVSPFAAVLPQLPRMVRIAQKVLLRFRCHVKRFNVVQTISKIMKTVVGIPGTMIPIKPSPTKMNPRSKRSDFTKKDFAELKVLFLTRVISQE